MPFAVGIKGLARRACCGLERTLVDDRQLVAVDRSDPSPCSFDPLFSVHPGDLDRGPPAPSRGAPCRTEAPGTHATFERVIAAPVSKFLVVIPAHDEEPVISTVVKSCLELDYPQSLFQVVVIADNCSDRTASLASRAGARVVERFDDLKKSKGYAIDYLIETLADRAVRSTRPTPW